MIIGLNLSHDASVSLHDEDGKIIFASGEERFNRIKSFWGFPKEALIQALEIAPPESISKVVLGSHSVIKPSSAELFSYLLNNAPDEYFDLANSPFPPGWFQESIDRNSTLDKFSGFNPKKEIKSFLKRRLEEVGIKSDIEFRNHHESHALSAIISSGFESCLCITLDGEGDFESGSVYLWENGALSCLSKIPRELSLGNVYTEVTARYGFKRVRHEGKITGLAAHGVPDISVEILSAYLSHRGGKFYKDQTLGKFAKTLAEVKNHDNRNFEAALIDCLAKQSKSFPDLASSAQSYLEMQVLSYIEYWKSKTGMTNLAVAGGVFANVKLNQRLIESMFFEKTYIYPNMGDGGLAPGAVWGSILSSGRVPMRTESVYLGKDYSVGEGLNEHQIDLIVQNIIKGGIVGFFQGRSEWGPRALCHRSIFASPGVIGISKRLNGRLKRTDFMPFAPIVLEEFAEEVFNLSTNSHIDNYNNMTVTVDVKHKYSQILKEVTNIDGTARPQIVHSDLKDVTAILSRFYQLTGIPALINTSFNTHEEPIVESPESALKLLKDGVLDFLVIGNRLFGPALDEL